MGYSTKRNKAIVCVMVNFREPNFLPGSQISILLIQRSEKSNLSKKSHKISSQFSWILTRSVNLVGFKQIFWYKTLQYLIFNKKPANFASLHLISSPVLGIPFFCLCLPSSHIIPIFIDTWPMSKTSFWEKPPFFTRITLSLSCNKAGQGCFKVSNLSTNAGGRQSFP